MEGFVLSKKKIIVTLSVLIMLLSICTISNAATYVASIGNRKYKTLQKAIDAVPKNGKQVEIKLLSNITSSENYLALIGGSRNIILDLNGFNIKGTNNKEIESITILNFGTLKIKGKGIISSENSIALENRGKLIISGGTFTSNAKYSEAVYNFREATMEIKGGTINPESDCALYNHGKLTISGGTISGEILNYSEGTMEIKGGTMSAKYSALSNFGKATISKGTISAEGYNPLYNFGKLTISGGKISAGIRNDSEGTMKIKGGTISPESNYALYNSGKLTISGGKIYSKDEEALRNSGKVTISGGTIKADNYHEAILNLSSGTLNIKGGKIIAENERCLLNYGTVKLSGKVTMTNNSSKYATIDNWKGSKYSKDVRGTYLIENKGGGKTILKRKK